MFIRFVISGRDEDSGRRQGLFQAGEALPLSGRMSEADIAQLDELQEWFIQHLAEPTRFSLSAKPHRKAQAISWFRDSATSTRRSVPEHGNLCQSPSIERLILSHAIEIEAGKRLDA